MSAFNFRDYFIHLDEISEIEDGRADDEKENGKYYLGNYLFSRSSKQHLFIMGTTISTRGFYEFDITDVRNYLYFYCEYQKVYEATHGYEHMRVAQTIPIEIMKVLITYDGPYKVYTVVLKTFWLRIIQRIWKRVYRALRARGSAAAQRRFEISGRWSLHHSNKGAVQKTYRPLCIAPV